MNSKFKFITLALVSGTAGLAAFGLSNTEFAARLPLDTVLAVTATIGVIHFALADYSRRAMPLRQPTTVLRPTPRRVVRVSACVERIAA